MFGCMIVISTYELIYLMSIHPIYFNISNHWVLSVILVMCFEFI